MATTLIVDGVTAGYGAVTVLRDVSLEARDGELTALLGVNGNGKSTLINCILGFVKPRSGRILLQRGDATIDLTRHRPFEVANLGVAAVPEGRLLAANLTVAENLMLAGGAPRGRRHRPGDNLDFCFTTFPVLAERRNQYASTLSGGQQQMLAIARALMTAPDVLVVDEPSTGLAPIVVGQVIAAIRTLRDSRGMTILMAEQSFPQAIAVASRAYVLSRGRIVRHFETAGDADTAAIRAAMMGMA